MGNLKKLVILIHIFALVTICSSSIGEEMGGGVGGGKGGDDKVIRKKVRIVSGGKTISTAEEEMNKEKEAKESLLSPTPDPSPPPPLERKKDDEPLISKGREPQDEIEEGASSIPIVTDDVLEEVEEEDSPSAPSTSTSATAPSGPSGPYRETILAYTQNSPINYDYGGTSTHVFPVSSPSSSTTAPEYSVYTPIVKGSDSLNAPTVLHQPHHHQGHRYKQQRGVASDLVPASSLHYGHGPFLKYGFGLSYPVLPFGRHNYAYKNFGKSLGIGWGPYGPVLGLNFGYGKRFHSFAYPGAYGFHKGFHKTFHLFG